jgi:hypothetical protein
MQSGNITSPDHQSLDSNPATALIGVTYQITVHSVLCMQRLQPARCILQQQQQP